MPELVYIVATVAERVASEFVELAEVTVMVLWELVAGLTAQIGFARTRIQVVMLTRAVVVKIRVFVLRLVVAEKQRFG